MRALKIFPPRSKFRQPSYPIHGRNANYNRGRSNRKLCKRRCFKLWRRQLKVAKNLVITEAYFKQFNANFFHIFTIYLPIRDFKYSVFKSFRLKAKSLLFFSCFEPENTLIKKDHHGRNGKSLEHALFGF